jgi:hypothetical protein
MNKIILIFSCFLCFMACKNESKLSYQDIEKRELARGVRKDSLFLGFTLGMPSKEFFLKCWDMNKQGIIREGNANLSVSYKMSEGLKYAAYMNFYPAFYKEKIYQMPLFFNYIGWSPWQADTQPEALQLDVLKLMEKWYGTGFIRLYDKKRGLSFIKIEGNRRIKIMQKPEMYVEVLITDVLAEKELEKEMPPSQ